MRSLFIVILLFIAVFKSYCQQLPIYSQYVLNEFLINPATAGFDGRTTVNLTGRKQWQGIPGAPETYSVSLQSRILKKGYLIKKGPFGKIYRKSTKGRVGLGAAVFSDQSGAISRIGVQFTYAYHIFIESSQLSFGLSGLAFQHKIKTDLVDFRDDRDNDLLLRIGKSVYIPDASFGINYMTLNYHIGFSVNQLFESKIKFGDLNPTSDSVTHFRFYTLTGILRKKLTGNAKWEYEPGMIMRINEKFNMNGDFSLRMFYQKEYWAGISYRTSGDFILMLGLRYNNFYFGYSFDYGFNKLSQIAYGSHEITLAIKFGDSTRRYRWLERY